MTTGTHFKGCLIPNCPKKYQTRGVCGSCYKQIAKQKRSIGDKRLRQQFENRLIMMGVLQPATMKGGNVRHRIGVSIKAIDLPWLPVVGFNGDCTKEVVFEDDPVEIDFMGMPESVAEKFDFSQIELNHIAWHRTEWSPGTFEKQVVMQLRYSFGVRWSYPIGHGMNRFDDHCEFGNGTYPYDLADRQTALQDIQMEMEEAWETI